VQLSADALDFYTNWTGVPQPLKKFDLVGVPGKGGAMENWGLLLFDEYRFLWNDVRRISIIASHQLLKGHTGCCCVSSNFQLELRKHSVRKHLMQSLLKQGCIGEVAFSRFGKLCSSVFIALALHLPCGSLLVEQERDEGAGVGGCRHTCVTWTFRRCLSGSANRGCRLQLPGPRCSIRTASSIRAPSRRLLPSSVCRLRLWLSVPLPSGLWVLIHRLSAVARWTFRSNQQAVQVTEGSYGRWLAADVICHEAPPPPSILH